MQLYEIPTTQAERLDYICDMILYRLGYPTVNIELNTNQLDVQIREQINIYQQYVPFVNQKIIDLKNNPDDYRIQVTDENNRPIKGIHSVFFSNDQFQSFSKVFRNFFITGKLVDMVEIMSFYDMQKKLLTIIRDWRWDERTSSIVFSSKIDRDQKQLIFYFYVPDLIDIPEYDFTWIINYSVQQQKEMLGRIRSKISSIDTSIGKINLDGDTLLSESKSEKDELINELKQRRSHYIIPIDIW